MANEPKRVFGGDGFDRDGFDWIGYHRLHRAAENGDVKAVQTLLDQGVSVDIIQTHGSNPWTPLLFAAQNGHLEVAKLLILRRADVNKADKYQQSSLARASRYGHANMCQLLLGNGA